MPRPICSIIIPTHNRRQMVIEAIESVLAQDFHDYELIVVDDGSTDGTLDALEGYRGERRFHLLSQENHGVSSARNRGIRQARGEWIAFLDSDDLWLPHKLTYQFSFVFRDRSPRILQTEEVWIRDGRRVNPKHKHRKYSGWIFTQCLPLCIISPSAALIHRELFEQCGLFDEHLPACEDYDLWLRTTLKYPVQTLPSAMIIKRGGHQDQLSRSYWGMDRFRLVSLLKIYRLGGLSNELKSLVYEQIQSRYSILRRGALKRGGSRGMDELLRRAQNRSM